jgi:probable phosphomutase (TIGR03848 family)
MPAPAVRGIRRRAPVRSGLVTSPEPTLAPTDDPNGKHAPRSTRIVLVRHAVTPDTGSKLSGRAPGIDLSEAGRTQAERAGERLALVPVAAVYASPIERTTQTAELIAKHHGLPVQPLPGVIEADYGEWTGEQLGDLMKLDLWKTVQAAPSRVRFPGGEAMVAMQTRMVEAIEALVDDHPGATIVVVSHADPIKAAVAHFTGLPLDLFQRVAVAPASVTVLEIGQFGATLLKSNDTGSLEELVPAPAPEPTTPEPTTPELPVLEPGRGAADG